jgi:hypothetical protein
MAVRHDPYRTRAERAFPKAQELLAGVPLRSLGLIEVGWHDTQTHPSAGSFALVADGGGLDELIGKVLRVSADGREVFALVAGARSLPVVISLARRAFAGLGLLALESSDALVEVIE